MHATWSTNILPCHIEEPGCLIWFIKSWIQIFERDINSLERKPATTTFLWNLFGLSIVRRYGLYSCTHMATIFIISDFVVFVNKYRLVEVQVKWLFLKNIPFPSLWDLVFQVIKGVYLFTRNEKSRRNCETVFRYWNGCRQQSIFTRRRQRVWWALWQGKMHWFSF